jgi:HlyD family secretion protein
MATPKKKTGRKIAVFSAIILVLAGLGTAAALRNRKPVITVQTEKAALRNLTEIVTATGKVQPVLQVKISPEVAGEIVEIPVKEGQGVKKGDLLVRIKPDAYVASRNSADANYRSTQANLDTSNAQAAKALAELKRQKELFDKKLVSDSAYDEARTAYEVAKAQAAAAGHQIEMSQAALRKAEEDLSKCTIYSPIDGTVSKLDLEVGERVVGTGMMAGTEIMTIADLNLMEARIEVSEVDVVRVKVGQKARLEVDSFRDKKFPGVVTRIANSAKLTAASTQQESTKFEVRIRITDRESFRPGMSTSAEIETDYRTNVLTVPIQSVTTRLPKGSEKKKEVKLTETQIQDEQELADLKKKKEHGVKTIDVVFGVENGKAKMLPVKRGLSDDNYYEIIEGLAVGQEVITGSYKSIARELEDEKPIKVDNQPKTPKSEEKK